MDRTGLNFEEKRVVVAMFRDGKSVSFIKNRLGCSARLIVNFINDGSLARFNFAEQHLAWDVVRWDAVIWSDEAVFVAPNNVAICVWGCFSGHAGIGPIFWIQGEFVAKTYISILQKYMLSYAKRRMKWDFIFQQDNDSVHCSQTVVNWFQQHPDLRVMDWPSQSSDLNPMEDLWDSVQKIVEYSNPDNKQDLWSIVHNCYRLIDRDKCQKLVNSMHQRCCQVLDLQ
jgi:hypothetical protein